MDDARSSGHADVVKTPRRFDAVTVGLHWATAVLILGMFASALLMAFGAGQDQAATLLYFHRSLGVATWIVAICRLGWRLSFGFLPPFPETMSKLQQWLAKASEYGLYAILLIQPLTGLAQSFTRGKPFPLLAWEAPSVMSRDKVLTDLIEKIHGVSALVLLALIGLHILAALFHRLVLKDEVLQSMLPWKPSPHKDIGVNHTVRE
ncbi:cytochrome b561 [Rhizobiales bacterium GAS191]|nr:cytochrome b561 [Rhizobiales bacterium GAS188]SEE31621.1 cytochrome b561 [Rhizobiales bacterium GAS191]